MSGEEHVILRRARKLIFSISITGSKDSNYDLFLFPSSHITEGMPNSILDAISLKIPVVTSNCGFVEDLFSKDYLTFLKATNIESIKKVLRDVLLNYKKYSLKAEKAFEFANQNYTEINFKNNLQKLYQKIK